MLGGDFGFYSENYSVDFYFDDNNILVQEKNKAEENTNL